MHCRHKRGGEAARTETSRALRLACNDIGNLLPRYSTATDVIAERFPLSWVSLPGLSVDVDDRAPPDLAGHEAAGGRYDVFQTDLHRRPFEVRFGQQQSEPIPGLDSFGLRACHAVDAEKRDTAEDERSDAGREIETLSHAARGHRAVRPDAGAHIGQRIAADRVDRRDPAFLL